MWDNIIEYLKDPLLVVKVQNFFGVIYKKSTSTEETSVIHSDRHNQEDDYDIRQHKRIPSDISGTSQSSCETDTSSECREEVECLISNKFWYYLFVIGTALGDEIFYATFIPFWFWNIDGAVGRRVVLVWTIVMYIGQGFKDIIRWPRPGYPVKKLQEKWAIEYGMPSTHAMVGVSIPFSVLLYTMDRYQYPVHWGTIIAVSWCTLICVSRVYLGMHSILDIAAGLLLSSALLVVLIPVVDQLDGFLLTSQWSPFIVITISILVIVYHPQSDKWTPTSDEEKARTFSHHLVNVFQPHPYEGPPEHMTTVMDFLNYPKQDDIPPKGFTKHEVMEVIKKAKPKKSPGYDLITNKVLRELSESGLRLLTSIYNAITEMQFIPPQWKVAQILMLLKPEKKPEDPKSYRPISLLPIPAKIYESLISSRILPIIEKNKLIPDHQFGFRRKHATIDQIHRLVNELDKTFETKKYCASAFLDISQAFDRVWHEGLLYKIKRLLPNYIYTILKSFIKDRHFFVQCGDAVSDLCSIKAGVPQGSVLGPLLYLIYTCDLPTSDHITTGTFADDTAILASHEDPNEATKMLQNGLDAISTWTKKWRIKVNESKSVNVTFTLRRGHCPPVKLNNLEVPQADHVRYLGLHLDKRLTWQKHIFTKRKQLGLQIRKLYWLIGRRSQLSLSNKLLLYKAILKPIWSYGIQLWGTASHSNIEIIQRFQNKMLRMITNAPWFVTNEQLHQDLQINTIRQEIIRQTTIYKERITSHPNRMAKVLMKKTLSRRLKRKMPQDILC